MNALSLFGKDPDPLAEEQEAKGFVPQGGWGFGRAWRDIQRSWGVDPGPEPEVIPLRPGVAAPGAGEEGHEIHGRNGDLRPGHAADEGQEPWEYAQHEAKRPRRVGEDEDDEFYIADEGDLGGTVAIIALCMLLACVYLIACTRVSSGS